MYLFHRHIDLASELKKAVGLAVGAAIYSAGLNLFLIPNDIIDGGITGISLLVQALTGIPFSVLIVLLNLPFFYIGYRRLGARLALSSTFAIVILSLCSSYFETMKPATSDPFLSTIFGGIIIGMGVGIVIKSGGSTDGTEIMAIWMDNKFPFSVGEIIMFFNFFILGAAGFVFSWNSTMYSLIAYFICSRMIDAVSTGLDSSKGVFIVTTSYDAVSDAIVHDMHRAVTRLHGQGGFLKDDKDVLYCVVSRLEITKLNPGYYVPATDPMVRLLTDLYNNETDSNDSPYVMGACTYARAFEHGCGFGGGNPHEVKPFPAGHGGAHGPDEAHNIPVLLTAIKMYTMPWATPAPPCSCRF